MGEYNENFRCLFLLHTIILRKNMDVKFNQKYISWIKSNMRM